MIIGVNGYINSGKDIVGDIIRLLTRNISGRNWDTAHWNIANGLKNGWGLNLEEDSRIYTWQIKKFACKLKQVASLLTGISSEKFEDQEFKNSTLGSEWNTIVEGRDFKGRIIEGSSITTEMTVRKFLQKLGTEAIRDELHENAWVNALFADYKPDISRSVNLQKEDFGKETITEKYPNWVITDCRFPNEAQAIKERGGLVIRVNRYPKTVELSRGVGHIEIPFDKNNDMHMNLYKGENMRKHASETSLDSWKFDYIIENDSDIESLIEKVRLFLKESKIIV